MLVSGEGRYQKMADLWKESPFQAFPSFWVSMNVSFGGCTGGFLVSLSISCELRWYERSHVFTRFDHVSYMSTGGFMKHQTYGCMRVCVCVIKTWESPSCFPKKNGSIFFWCILGKCLAMILKPHPNTIYIHISYIIYHISPNSHLLGSWTW